MNPIPIKALRKLLQELADYTRQQVETLEAAESLECDVDTFITYSVDKEGGSDFGGDAAAPVPVGGVPVSVDLGGGLKMTYDNDGSGHLRLRLRRWTERVPILPVDPEADSRFARWLRDQEGERKES